jgi:hypothetical protein
MRPRKILLYQHQLRSSPGVLQRSVELAVRSRRHISVAETYLVSSLFATVPRKKPVQQQHEQRVCDESENCEHHDADKDVVDAERQCGRLDQIA